MYELNSSNANPVVNCEGLTKNVTSVGFQEDGKWMFTGGEDCSARIWDLRKGSMQCQRIFQVSAPVNCVCLHPNQAELIVGDQSGIIHIWDLKTDHNEQLVCMKSVRDFSEINYLYRFQKPMPQFCPWLLTLQAHFLLL